MKKRGINVLLIGLMFLLFAAAPTEAKETGVCGDNISWELDKDGILYIHGTGNMWDGFWDEYNYLTFDGQPYHNFSSSIKKVVIGEGVKSIGVGAFLDCYNISSVTIPKSVNSIGEEAFGNCGKISSVTIPDSVTNIGDRAFSYCESLTAVTIPKSVKNIGTGIFYGCHKLSSVIFLNSIESIPDETFEYCSSLKAFVIQDNVTSIGREAFCGCNSLSKLTIPKSVKTIGEEAFSGCGNLTTISIPDGIKKIEYGTFSDCYSLLSVKIPESVESIEDCSFSYCNNLSSVTIPEGIEKIGEETFYECENLTSIMIPKSVVSIGNDAFEYCDDLSIYGIAGSYAETYANENHIPFNVSKTDSTNEKIPLARASVSLSETSFTFDGKEKKPEITVEYNGNILSSGDYTVTYEDNVYAGEAKVIISGIGSRIGTVKKSFMIEPGNAVNITLDGNGGYFKKKASTKLQLKLGEEYLIPLEPQRPGYGFLGWYTKKSKGTKVTSKHYVTNDSARKLYARWQKEKYSINYNYNDGWKIGEKDNPESYTISDKVVLAAPARTGYIFSGWYTTANYKSKTKITQIKKGSVGNQTLYAKWKPISYNIKFIGNGSTSGSTKSMSAVKYGEEKSLTKNGFKKKGYEFAGWSTSKNGSVKWQDKQKIRNLCVKNNNTIKLYAVWKIKTSANLIGLKSDTFAVTLIGLNGAKANLPYTAMFSDSYFEKSTTLENGKLSKLSALGALSTYTKGQTISFLKCCGFDNITSKMFSGDGLKSTGGSNNHAVAYMGIRKRKDYDLIAVVISGYSDGGYEWVSNFNVGNKAYKKGTLDQLKYHEGFKCAADEVVKLIKKYTKQSSKGKTVKYWIMGHSRGAAITNLVSVALSKKNLSNVYAYGFATPRYVRNPPKKSYGNIFNYISKQDFVTEVAPEMWGFGRLGRNIPLKNESKMKSLFQQYVGRSYDGFTESEMHDLIDDFIGLSGETLNEYYTSECFYSTGRYGKDMVFYPYEYAQKGLALAVTETSTITDTLSTGAGFMKMISYSIRNNAALDLTRHLIKAGKKSNKIWDSHGMITYLAWIDAHYPK